MTDLQKGGEVVFPNGWTHTITPDENRIFGKLWGNGAFVEVLVYKEALVDEDESDRIQLLVTPAGCPSRGWLMNAEDAMTIIQGLAIAVSQVINENYPLTPQSESLTDNTKNNNQTENKNQT